MNCCKRRTRSWFRQELVRSAGLSGIAKILLVSSMMTFYLDLK
jgi:hypothetical protein